MTLLQLPYATNRPFFDTHDEVQAVEAQTRDGAPRGDQWEIGGQSRCRVSSDEDGESISLRHQPLTST
jgi:hypothetical protein